MRDCDTKSTKRIALLRLDRAVNKLFRDMEKKIQAAKAFQVAVTIETKGNTKDVLGSFKGSLLLTNDNKARLKISGDDFGEARNWEIISNGKELRLKPVCPAG